MQTSLSQDERFVLQGFTEFLTAYEQRSAHEVAATAPAIHEAGWLSAAVAASEIAQPFSVLTAMIEQAGDRAWPFAYPLIEAWTALRLVEAAGGDADALLDESPLVSVAQETLWAAPSDLGAVAYGNDVQTVIAVHGDMVRAVAVEPGAATGGTAFDETLPTAIPRPVGDARDVGRVDAGILAQIRAEFLTLQAAEALGACDHLLRRTVEYLGQREQFGQKLSQMQALQHRAADHFADVETSRSLVYYAGWACEHVAPEAEQYALMAKGYAAEAAWRIADDAVQLHGGVGFTAEAGLHRPLKRIVVRALGGITASDCLAAGGAAAVARGEMLGLVA